MLLKSSLRRRVMLLGALLIVALALLVGIKVLGNGTSAEVYRVAHVVDGDTIVLENGERVRYLGIDAPETVHPEKPVECYGPEATERNKELVEGKRVQLERDQTDRDHFGRLLRYVYVNGTFVNGQLVQEGYAYSSYYPPDTKHYDLLLALEIEARQENRGLWSACPQ
jgi:micrococcal nuclease